MPQTFKRLSPFACFQRNAIGAFEPGRYETDPSFRLSLEIPFPVFHRSAIFIRSTTGTDKRPKIVPPSNRCHSFLQKPNLAAWRAGASCTSLRHPDPPHLDPLPRNGGEEMSGWHFLQDRRLLSPWGRGRVRGVVSDQMRRLRASPRGRS